MAEAYKIGRVEAKACANLLTEIPEEIGSRLADLVKSIR